MNGATTITVCIIELGTGALGTSCMVDSDCLRGMGCDNVAQRCTHYCRTGSNDCGSKACLTEGEPLMTYNGNTYGYCAL